MKKIICITTGDVKGIGPEVTFKALKKIKTKKDVQFFVFRNHEINSSHIIKGKNVTHVSSIKEAFKAKTSLVDICLETRPPHWVYESGMLCMNKKAKALVTAPLSKTEIMASGYKYAKGHTEILKKLSKRSQVFMLFLGNFFNVFLLTGHIPLSQVTRKLDESLMLTGIKMCHKSLKKTKNFKKPFALLGLNPHAGENGLIGKQEQSLFKTVIKKLKKISIPVSEPLTPDVAFLKRNWEKYSCFICQYHDQALIPFKSLNDHSKSVQVTLGLPFVRTGVSHGCAFDLFGKNKADETSMKKAIEKAVELI